MVSIRSCRFIWICFILAAACHPRIYSFTTHPETMGNYDTIRVCWKVKGKATLLIHDINYPNTGNGILQPLTLLITQHGNSAPFLPGGHDTIQLGAHDTIQLPLSAAEGCLDISKQPDGNMDDRLRYITLVATSHGKDSLRRNEIAVRPDTVSDEVVFRTTLHGDTLIAGGVNNPLRWGDDYYILTVADTSNRSIDVIHAAISRVLHRGDPPDGSFKGTPVKGDWILRTYLTDADKSNFGGLPNMLKILITIKHR